MKINEDKVMEEAKRQEIDGLEDLEEAKTGIHMALIYRKDDNEFVICFHDRENGNVAYVPYIYVYDAVQMWNAQLIEKGLIDEEN